MGKRWTKWEEEYIRESRLLSFEEVAEYLNRSVPSIRRKCLSLKAYRQVACISCGEVVDKNLSSMYCKSCHPSRQELRRISDSTPLNRFKRCKTGAKARGISFNITLEEFSEYWQEPCSYCGGTINTVGLDRVDSSLGYEDSNVVPCCTKCNLMKRHYSTEDWLTHMRKILNNLEAL